MSFKDLYKGNEINIYSRLHKVVDYGDEYTKIFPTVSFDPWTHTNPNYDCALGNRKYTATWTPIVYSIGYTLNGGEVSSDNRTTYTVETGTFTLNNPTRNDYTFWGWTGTGITGTKINVEIPRGSIGDRNYEANWEINHYSIYFNTE